MTEIQKKLCRTAECINLLADFLGQRDVTSLDEKNLADVFVLFGGTILCGADVLAQAIRNSVAKKYVIVGGAGHTTEALREKIKAVCGKEFETDARSEAECLDFYIHKKFGLHADFLETKSTNCGNNITFLLELLHRENVPHKKIILCQDATMQRRMGAVLARQSPETVPVNFASYKATVIPAENSLSFAEEIPGMWDMDRYIDLLMGEIPRLTDDENGYGPKGKDYLVHVDVPEDVREAFDYLRKEGYDVRKANPAFG